MRTEEVKRAINHNVGWTRVMQKHAFVLYYASIISSRWHQILYMYCTLAVSKCRLGLLLLAFE